MILQDNEKKGSRQAMKEDIITKILDRKNLNEAFKNVKANKGASGIDDLSVEETAEYIRYYCQYKNVQLGQNIFVQNCTFLFSSFCTILFYPIKILMPYLPNLLFYTNYL